MNPPKIITCVLIFFNGVFSSSLWEKPLLQFKSVEIENIVQDYEDKLRDQQYNRTLNLGENTIGQ